MKRFALILLVVMFALTAGAFGAPIVAGTEGSSELTFGAIVGADGTTQARYTNLIWTTVAQIDKNNYILFGVTSAGNPSLPTFKLRAFSGNMILDDLLGLPAGTLKLKFGWDDVAVYNLPPSGYAYENQMGYDPGPRATMAALGAVGPVNYRVALEPGVSLFQGWGVPLGPNAVLVNVYGSTGPFFLSAAYNSNHNALGTGKVGAEINWRGAAGPLALTGDVEASYDMSLDSPFIVGAAMVVGYGWLSVDASTNYSAPSATNLNGFNALGFGIEARPDMKLQRYGGSFGIDVNLNPTVTVPIRSVDGSVWFRTPGPAKIRVGYLWTQTSNGGGDYYSPTSLPNGGIYCKYDMSW